MTAGIEAVRHIWGDTWNVNPIALKRVEALFCRNERAVLRLRLARRRPEVMLVPVAAILVAGLRLGILPSRSGPAPHRGADDRLRRRTPKGAELGWFEHGSTIVVLAPRGFDLWPGLREGAPLRMGEPLMRLPDIGR